MPWDNFKKLPLHMTKNQTKILFIFFENRGMKIIVEFFIIPLILI